jgi:predicted transcriptional regulator
MTVLPTVKCQDCIQILRREGFDQMPVVDSSGYVGRLFSCHAKLLCC